MEGTRKRILKHEQVSGRPAGGEELCQAEGASGVETQSPGKSMFKEQRSWGGAQGQDSTNEGLVRYKTRREMTANCHHFPKTS